MKTKLIDKDWYPLVNDGLDGPYNETAYEPTITQDLADLVDIRAKGMLEGKTYTKRRHGCNPTTWGCDVTELDSDVLVDMLNNIVATQGMGALNQIAVRNFANFWKRHAKNMACHSLGIDLETLEDWEMGK